MDAAAILLIVEKGLSLATLLIQAGISAEPEIIALLQMVTGANKGTVTPEELAANEARLDQLLADFNADLPP